MSEELICLDLDLFSERFVRNKLEQLAKLSPNLTVSFPSGHRMGPVGVRAGITAMLNASPHTELESDEIMQWLWWDKALAISICMTYWIRTGLRGEIHVGLAGDEQQCRSLHKAMRTWI